jgi:hypothetical protein
MWEYKVVTCPISEFWLASLGEDGWELVVAETVEGIIRSAVFKRPKQSAPAETRLDYKPGGIWSGGPGMPYGS